MNVTLKPGADGVRIREAPVDGKPIGQTYSGDMLKSLESDADTQRKVGVEGEWLRVKTAIGAAGYIAAWLVVLAEGAESDEATLPDEGAENKDGGSLSEREVPFLPATTLEVDGEIRILVKPTSDGLRLRNAPVDGAAIGSVGKDTVLISLETPDDTRRKIGVTGDWLKVRTFYGQTGYTAAWFLEAYTGPAPEKPSSPLKALNITGMNLDIMHPLGAPEAHRLQGLGWVRILYNVSAAKGSEDIGSAYDRYMPHIEKYAKAGLKVVLVLNHQTYGEGQARFWPWETMNTAKWRDFTNSFTDMIARIAQQYVAAGVIQAYQVWNEQDAPIGAVASVPMIAQDYAIVLGGTIKAVRAVDSTAAIIMGGHTSGPGNGSKYALDAIAALPNGVKPDGVAFHPYGRGLPPNDIYANFGHIDDSMKYYTGVMPGKPVWITEWGILDCNHHDPKSILNYASNLVNHLKKRYPGQVAALIWYAWAMSMHNGYGLVNAQNQAIQPLYDEFKKL